MLVGCDPEVLVIVEGKPHRADDILKYHHDVYSPGPVLIGGIGTDGAGFPAELRPGASPYPKEVVHRLKILLSHTLVHVRQCTPVAGLYLTPCASDEGQMLGTFGGHIHVSDPALKRGTPSLVATLLSPILVATDLLDPQQDAYRRATSSYGNPYNYRWQGTAHIEFRAPSATWLAHPSLAEAYLRIVSKAAVNAARILATVDALQGVTVLRKAWKLLGVGKYWPNLIIAKRYDGHHVISAAWRERSDYWDTVGGEYVLRHEKHVEETLDYMARLSQDRQAVGVFKFFLENVHQLRRRPGIPVHKTWRLWEVPDSECLFSSCPQKGKILKKREEKYVRDHRV